MMVSEAVHSLHSRNTLKKRRQKTGDLCQNVTVQFDSNICDIFLHTFFEVKELMELPGHKTPESGQTKISI